MKRTLRAIVASLFLLAVFNSFLHAQPENPAQPVSRIYHQLVHHEKTNSVFLFGGNYTHGGGDAQIPDVWRFSLENKRWTYVGANRPNTYVDPYGNRSVVPAHSPVLDTESDKIIFFNRSKKTWAFDPVTLKWEKMAPVLLPPTRCGQVMAYDSESDRVLMFGGFKCFATQDPPLDDLWAYDYNSDSWEEILTDTVPEARMYTEMIYHAASDRIYMWGGRQTKIFEDTTMWEFDYNQASWYPIPAKGGPDMPYSYSEMIYHPVSQEIFMYGGGPLYNTFTGYNRDESWIFSREDSSWMLVDVVNVPEKISNHSMVYLPESNEIFLFGGEIGNEMYTNKMLPGTWIMDYATKTWREVLFAYAGKDGLWCPDQMEEVLVGGAPTAWGGVEPYSYSWDAAGYLNGSVQEVNDLIDDPLGANPALISLSDSVAFYLEVTDSTGSVALDTVWHAFSNLSVCPDLWTAEFFRGDSLQLEHCVEGGMGPLSYLWEPAEHLSDTSVSNPWASTDTLSVTFELIATDTLGCEVRSEYMVNYSTTGIDDPSFPKDAVSIHTMKEGNRTILMIEHNLPESLTMEIFRADGSIVEILSVECGRQQKSLDHYSTGIYIYRFRDNQKLLGSGKLIVH